MMDDARHAPLVLLAWAIDVEVPEPYNRALHLGDQPADIVVEDKLRVAIDVQRALVRGLLGEARAGAVDGRRRGVHHRDLPPHSKVQQLLGVREVVVHHVAPVVLKSVRTRALMQNRADWPTLEVAALQRGSELFLVHVVGVFGPCEIRELRTAKVWRRSQVVHDQNVTLSSAIQLMNEVAADEPCPSRNDNHLASCDAVSFFTMLVVENPSTVGTISTRPPEAITSSCPTTVSSV